MNTTGRLEWDAVVINFNGALFLDPCLRSLSKVRRGPSRIIVVDNASEDDSLNELAGWPQAEVVSLPENLGYAGGANRGVEVSEAPIVVLLNPDVEVDPDFGEHLVVVFEQNPALGAAGAKLRYPDSGLIQHAGGTVHWPELTTSHIGESEPDSDRYSTPRDIDYATGATLALRREALDSVGGLDEQFFPAYWEDVDLCYRLREAGWAVQFHPGLTGIHHEGEGKPRDNTYYLHWTRNRLFFARRHLTVEQWRHEFIPAEVDRLNGELRAIESADWYVQSGGLAIDHFARSGGTSGSSLDGSRASEQLFNAIDSIRSLPDLADPRPGPVRPEDGVIRRLKRFLSRFSGRIYAEDLYWQQRQFNEAVVRAFEAQDRLNREQTVQLLYMMLLIGRQGMEQLDIPPQNVGPDDTQESR